MSLLFNFSYLTSKGSRQCNKAALWKRPCQAKTGGQGFLNHAVGYALSVSWSQTHNQRAASVSFASVGCLANKEKKKKARINLTPLP